MMNARSFFRITALLLAACLLWGCGAKAAPAAGPVPASDPPETSVPAVAEVFVAVPTPVPSEEIPDAAPLPWEDSALTAERPSNWHADVHFDDMTWRIPDMTAFDEAAARLSHAGTAAEAEELYAFLTQEYIKLRTDSELVWIEFYGSDEPGEDLSAACQTIDDMLTRAGDVLLGAASGAVNGGPGEEFSAYLGEEMARELAEYEDMPDREAELWARETELKLRYNELAGSASISEPSLNYRLSTIFMELIRVRNEIASLYGYDSYARFAYETVFRRDYTPEDAAALCRALKPYAREYFARCYYSDAFQQEIGQFSAGELMDLLRSYAPRISPQAGEAQEYMEEHGLYMLESVERVAGVGFTTLLPLYNAPFLFNSLWGNVYDVQDTFHEFGHYYDAYVNPEPDVIGSRGSYDIFEIHSTSMEALLYGWYDEIFGAEADTARIYCLDSFMDSIVSGCLYDEFLRYCYDHPDMTPDEVNRAYYDIAVSYGKEFFRGADRYNWMNVSHNFENPFYYISYAASTLVSLQLWSLAERDHQAAVEKYNRIISRGAYAMGYFELVDSEGLIRFSDDLDGCLREAFDTLLTLCGQYDAMAQAA